MSGSFGGATAGSSSFGGGGGGAQGGGSHGGGAQGGATGQGGGPFSGGGPPQGLSPDSLAKSFTNGMQSGSPISAGTEALAHGAASPVGQQPTVTPQSTPAATAPSSGGHLPTFETAQAAPAATTPSYTATAADAGSSYVAAPASTAQPAATGGAVGSLPAYGSDLRPPIQSPTTPSAPPAVQGALAAPAAAPVNPSNAASNLSQPAVVRQATVTTPPAPVGLAANAAAAVTAGAMAGAASTQAVAQQRLQRLLEAVARQEPKLRWAIGDREDGSTILATDLACGWIPPRIEIPTGVMLLHPELRRGKLVDLLGETTQTATYTPIHYLPLAKDAEPVMMSNRARMTIEVEDPGWELAQATKWRDGLPRLAHTLAKAGAAGTGVLESELELLHEHLDTVTKEVIDGYPDRIDPTRIGNWQLLATIDALLHAEKVSANYHLAWFQALNMALKGEERR